MKRIIYVMRHGQTEYNLQRIVQGACDSPLTELGICQAKRAREYFVNNNISIDKAFCSPLKRAVATLNIVLDGKISISIDDDLTERNFGEIEGTDNIPDYVKDFPFGDELVAIGAESESDCQDRVSSAIKEIVDNNDGDIIIMSHGYACAQFARRWDEHSYIHFTQIAGNCAIYKYEYEEGIFRLIEVIEQEKFVEYK